MKRLISSDLLLACVCLLFGAVAGFAVGKQPAKMRALENELARLRLELRQSAISTQPPSFAPREDLRASDSARPSEKQPPPLEEGRPQEEAAIALAARMFEHLVTRAVSERDDEFTTMVRELGIEENMITVLKSNLVELHWHAIAAGEPLRELASARAAYDKQMRSLLDEESYRRYRAYEESKPAVREYDMLREYVMNNHSLTVDPAHAEEIVRLIREAGATTTETWHNPYDPLPRPAVGEGFIERLEMNFETLVNTSSALLESAAASELPAPYVELLISYYTSKIDQAHTELLFWDRPLEDIRKEMLRRMEQTSMMPTSGP